MPGTTVVKFPSGYRGITHATTNESDQEEIFFPCDGRLIAVNAEGDTDMGSVVCDLNEDSEIDPDRAARLQSAFAVIKYPFGGNNAIAFQLGPTGQEDTAGGYFIDRPDSKGGGEGADVPTEDPGHVGGAGGGGGPPEDADVGGISNAWKDKVIAQGSWIEGGPFRVGEKEDRHVRGEDDEGRPICSLHFDTHALFKRNKREDGPLMFEGEYPDCGDQDQPVKVHLTWDDVTKMWRWYTTSPMD